MPRATGLLRLGPLLVVASPPPPRAFVPRAGHDAAQRHRRDAHRRLRSEGGAGTDGPLLRFSAHAAAHSEAADAKAGSLSGARLERFAVQSRSPGRLLHLQELEEAF